MRRIEVNNVNRESRIGKAFNSLFKIINASTDDDVEFDCSNNQFFHPFFIAPLAIFRDNITGRSIDCINLRSPLKSYLEAISFYSPREINSEEDVDDIIKEYSNKSYTPVCKFNARSETEVDKISSKIQKLIEIQSKVNDYRAKGSLTYMFSELISNIVEHSDGKYGYIYSQYLKNENSVDICIADNGITILGSYLKSEREEYRSIESSAKALVSAVNGFSTKDKPAAENRGYGISTSIKMLVKGLKGAFFILSGDAFYRNDGKDEGEVVSLPEGIEWSGTIVLLRIPLGNIPKDFDIYQYAE